MKNSISSVFIIKLLITGLQHYFISYAKMLGWKTGIQDIEKGHGNNQDIDGWIQFNIESFGSLYLKKDIIMTVFLLLLLIMFP